MNSIQDYTRQSAGEATAKKMHLELTPAANDALIRIQQVFKKRGFKFPPKAVIINSLLGIELSTAIDKYIEGLETQFDSEDNALNDSEKS